MIEDIILLHKFQTHILIPWLINCNRWIFISYSPPIDPNQVPRPPTPTQNQHICGNTSNPNPLQRNCSLSSLSQSTVSAEWQRLQQSQYQDYRNIEQDNQLRKTMMNSKPRQNNNSSIFDPVLPLRPPVPSPTSANTPHYLDSSSRSFSFSSIQPPSPIREIQTADGIYDSQRSQGSTFGQVSMSSRKPIVHEEVVEPAASKKEEVNSVSDEEEEELQEVMNELSKSELLASTTSGSNEDVNQTIMQFRELSRKRKELVRQLGEEAARSAVRRKP